MDYDMLNKQYDLLYNAEYDGEKLIFLLNYLIESSTGELKNKYIDLLNDLLSKKDVDEPSNDAIKKE